MSLQILTVEYRNFPQNWNRHTHMDLRKISLLSKSKLMHTINEIQKMVSYFKCVNNDFIIFWVSFLRSSEWYVPSYYARIERNTGTGTKGLWRGTRTKRLLGGHTGWSVFHEGLSCNLWALWGYSVPYMGPLQIVFCELFMCRWYRSRYKLGVFVCTLLKVLIYNFTITARFLIC